MVWGNLRVALTSREDRCEAAGSIASRGGVKLSTAPFDADMAGTWSANGSIVDITQPIDSFVRDMPFTWGPDQNGVASLSGDHVFSGTRIQIILTRVP